MNFRGNKTIEQIYRNSNLVSKIYLGPIVIFQTEDFDDSDIIFRIGITSDLHMAQDNESAATVHNKALKYANLVNSLCAEAGGRLDVLAACGDYTSTGAYPQGAGFASALSGILNALESKPEFAFCYGNHDTCWEGNMPISASSSNYTSGTHTWEEVLSSAGIFTPTIPTGLEGEGVYLWTKPVEGKAISIIGLETDKYAPNVYKNNVLTWLDSYLAQIDSNSPCIILSHAPITESKVFGADPELDCNATWAGIDKDESGNIGALHNILSKYNNVYYFSGHTHRLPLIDSHIMSAGYTALNVGSFYGSNLFAVQNTSTGKNVYVDDPSTDPKTGISTALLLEMDKNNEIRIKRIWCNASHSATAEYTYTTDENNKQIYSMTPGTLSFGKANYNNLYHEWKQAFGDVETYSQDARAEGKNISLPNPEIIVSNANVSVDESTKKQRLNIDWAFKTAAADNLVNCYKIKLMNTSGKVLYEKWASGNWNDITSGVAAGNTHRDATKFNYTNCTQLITDTINSPLVAEFSAYDIFGNEIKSNLTQPQQLLLCGNQTIDFVSTNGTSAVIDMSLSSGRSSTAQIPVYFSQLDGSFDNQQSFKIGFDVRVSDRGKRANGAYENVRIMFSIGTLNGKNCALLLQDGGLICTSDASGGWSGSLGTSGAKLGNTRAENGETQNVHLDFTFDKNARTFKIDISNSDGTDNTFTINIANHMASTEDFVMNPCIIFRTAKFEISNFAFTNI